MSADEIPDLFDGQFTPPPPRPADGEGSRRPQRQRVDLLADLNPQQREAVTHDGRALLVVAGAGSGKTRVLTRRIAHLVSDRRAHPGSILAITFTNKAAAEMRSRVIDVVGNRAKLMWVATFHSACVRILRAEIHRFGMRRTFSIYDDADAKRLMQLVCSDLGIDPKKSPVRKVLNWVSNLKNELVDHESASAHANDPEEEPFVAAYKEYQRRLVAAGALDFDDLIMTTVHLLQAFDEVRESYRRRFRHVLVDEYQDTNHAQYELIRQLCSDQVEVADPTASTVEPSSLMVVGDSDQSIYAFRGATIRNILDFESDFPGARTVVLDQNYRSTQNVLNAANAVIANNDGRQSKRLWSESGDGELLVGYVADTEHDEAQFVADEIDKLHDAGEPYSEMAVFYRTNAQSRAFEEVLIRVGLPYKVVGGVRFYERKEVRDALAYLRTIANPTDTVAVRRILNVPKRGIGSRAEACVEALATREEMSFTDALRRADEAPGMNPRSAKQIAGFVAMLDKHQALVADGAPADQVLTSVLADSGYLAVLQASTDPQDETRVENLQELVAVAQDFVAQVGVVTAEDLAQIADIDLGTDGADGADGPDGPDADGPDDRGGDATVEAAELGEELAEAAPEADGSLAAFLERTALVADSDQIPDADESGGVVTLMTLHTAKGLEFDTVFLTGMEDGVFPHQRTFGKADELAEERRLAYVGITRARKRLHLSRAEVRVAWGAPQHNPPSRFLDEIPSTLVDWRRTAAAQTSWRNTSASSRQRSGGYGSSAAQWGTGRRGGGAAGARREPLHLEVGDRVSHSHFGLGSVVRVLQLQGAPVAEIDFGSAGTKHLNLQLAPLEKL